MQGADSESNAPTFSSYGGRRPTGMPPLNPDLAAAAAAPVWFPPLSSAAVASFPRQDFHFSGHLPPRALHRRSVSEIPFRASQLVKQEVGCNRNEGENVVDLIDSYMNLDGLEGSKSENESYETESGSSGTTLQQQASPGGSLGMEKKESGKRSGDVYPNTITSRHCRSLSMDSMIGNMSFELPKHHPVGHGNFLGQHSQEDHGDFSGNELKKIMANAKLAEIALHDPKRAKRILANRQSAARSKERKVKYVAELENKVHTLQTEATTLSAKLTLLQRDAVGLTSQNNELRFRLQAMEQQAHLRDALNEALSSEVQRLKFLNAELGQSHSSSSFNRQLTLNSSFFQLQQQEIKHEESKNEQEQQPSRQNNLIVTRDETKE